MLVNAGYWRASFLPCFMLQIHKGLKVFDCVLRSLIFENGYLRNIDFSLLIKIYYLQYLISRIKSESFVNNKLITIHFFLDLIKSLEIFGQIDKIQFFFSTIHENVRIKYRGIENYWKKILLFMIKNKKE